MSKASDMKRMRDTLTAYPLLRTRHVASFLDCDPDHVRKLAQAGRLPYTDIGLGERTEYRFDPLDVVVLHLAEKEGLSPEEFWERHGPEGTPDACSRHMARLRRLQAA